MVTLNLVNVFKYTLFFLTLPLTSNMCYNNNYNDNKTMIGIDVAHPGIDKTIDPEERRYVRYYQWVCFCLFFQVTICSIIE